jgi:hypothetical protein
MPAPKAAIAAPADPSVSPADRRLRQRIALHSDAIITAMIAAAEDGDVGAGKFLLERILAPQRTSPLGEAVNLDGLTPAQQAEAIKARLAAGELAIDEAEALMKSVETAQRIQEATNMMARLAELERRIAALGGGAAPIRRNVIDVDAPEPALPAPKNGHQ